MVDKMYSVRECANILGVKVRTVRQWIVDGKIMAKKFPTGGMWHIPETEIIRLQENINADKD